MLLTKPKSSSSNGFIHLLPAFGVLLLGGIIQNFTFLNHDVAWVLYSSQRLLDGGIFGKEIVAANPPLIWWISAVPKQIANWLNFDPITVYRLFVIVVAAGAIFAFDRMARTVTDLKGSALLSVLLAVILSLGVHRDFGQREHLAVMLIMPWLAYIAIYSCSVRQRNIFWAVATGILAGIGIAFKPYFLAVILLIELYLMMRQKNLLSFLRLDVLAIGATGALYLLMLYLFAQPYLNEVIPKVSQVYWAFGYPYLLVVEARFLEIALLIITLLIVAVRGMPPVPGLLALSALGFLLAAIVQAKGYSYHFYPVWALTLVTAATVIYTTDIYGKVTAAIALPLIYGSANVYNGILDRTVAGKTGEEISCTVEFVKKNVPPNGSFLAFSTHPFPGFPVTNYAHRTWISKSNSRIFLPSIAQLRMISQMNDKEKQLLQFAEKQEREAALRDISRLPHLVLIDAKSSRHAIGNSRMDFLAFYLEDENFRRHWKNYREIESCYTHWRAFALERGI